MKIDAEDKKLISETAELISLLTALFSGTPAPKKYDEHLQEANAMVVAATAEIIASEKGVEVCEILDEVLERFTTERMLHLTKIMAEKLEKNLED